MMHIDTHKAFNKLVDAGLQKEAAETIIGVVEESRKYDLDNLATKQDIAAIKQELSDTKSELKQDIANIRLEIANVQTGLKEEIADVKIQLSKITENMNMIKWLCVGILIPLVAASIKVLFSTMFGQ